MLNFAVVREDWRVEQRLIESIGARCALVVASGGCTALALSHARPALGVTAFDTNADQLVHARTKAKAIADGARAALNIDDSSPDGLSQSGQFEKLFRVLRASLTELVTSRGALEDLFEASAEHRRTRLEHWRASAYWPVAFDLAFTDSLLHAMFTTAATRHAAPGSYPRYFQRAFEAALSSPGASTNPWLEHVLLQRYRHPEPFLTSGARLPVEWVQGTFTDVPQLERFDLVSLSNIFDWSEPALISSWARAAHALRPGAVVLWRQLNNTRDWTELFEGFEVLKSSTPTVETERAFFYERLVVLRRR